MKTECFIVIKPDAVRLGRVGDILKELEDVGFVIEAARMLQMAEMEAKALYAKHTDMNTWYGLIEFMTSGKSLIAVVSHDELNAIEHLNAIRDLLRNKYATNDDVFNNAVHITDNELESVRERNIFW